MRRCDLQNQPELIARLVDQAAPGAFEPLRLRENQDGSRSLDLHQQKIDAAASMASDFDLLESHLLEGLLDLAETLLMEPGLHLVLDDPDRDLIDLLPAERTDAVFGSDVG